MTKWRIPIGVIVALGTAHAACGDVRTGSVERSHAPLAVAAGETESWTKLRFFEAKTNSRAIYDDARKEFVLLPGYASSPETSATTWTWNGSLKLASPKNQPGLRAQASVAYDRDKKRVILFGGSGEGSRETWSWDGTEWTQLSPALSPPARYAAPMTYDPVRKVVLLAGGHASTFLTDTWSFDGQTWRDETPTTAKLPAIYAESAMLFDENAGAPTTIVPDNSPAGCSTMGIWRYRAGAWQRENVLGEGPTVCITATGFDPVRKQPIVFGTKIENGTSKGNKIWAHSGTAWQEIPSDTPPTGFLSTSAAAFGGGGLIVVGGQSLDGLPIHAVQHWNGSSWQVDAASRSPGPRTQAAVTTLANGSVFLFGGYAGSGARDTWTFDGKLWEERSSPVRPQGRSRARIAFDSTRNEVVLFGGINQQSQWLTDTWTWNGTWTEHTPPVNPGLLTQGYGSGTSYDVERDRTFVLDNTGPVGSRMKVWAWNGQTRQWSFVPTSSGPRALQDASFAYDPIRKVSVMFGGDLVDDTWTWDGSAWTSVSPKNRPPGRRGAPLAWDALHERLVLFGGYGTLGMMNDVWTWDGQDWTSLVNENAAPGTSLPGAREAGRLTPMGTAGKLLLWGGDGPQGVFGDAWVFQTRGAACKAGSECSSGTCVDGVCCDSAACGSCQTCAGLDRGVCTSVVNAEDPDSCSTKDKKRCGSQGTCIGDVSASCKSASNCATGFCVDGVCCNTACDLPCEACAAVHKLVATDDGRCGAAKVGENPGGRCSGGATCNVSGSCETRTPASCKTERMLDPGNGQLQDCSPYRCNAGACERTCKTYADCTFPASCSTEGRCELPAPPPEDSGGCSARGSSEGVGTPSAAVLFALIALIARRGLVRRRTASPQG